MLKWKKKYYKSNNIKKAMSIQFKIDHQKPVPGIYLITLSNNPDNILEIIPAVALVQKTLYDRCPEIIGMADGKEDAIQLAVQIIEEVFSITGAFQIKSFFENR